MLDSINEIQQGTRYANEEAAMDIFGLSLKPLLSAGKSHS
jgi:hypothetical protein